MCAGVSALVCFFEVETDAESGGRLGVLSLGIGVGPTSDRGSPKTSKTFFAVFVCYTGNRPILQRGGGGHPPLGMANVVSLSFPDPSLFPQNPSHPPRPWSQPSGQMRPHWRHTGRWCGRQHPSRTSSRWTPPWPSWWLGWDRYAVPHVPICSVFFAQLVFHQVKLRGMKGGGGII